MFGVFKCFLTAISLIEIWFVRRLNGRREFRVRKINLRRCVEVCLDELVRDIK